MSATSTRSIAALLLLGGTAAAAELNVTVQHDATYAMDLTRGPVCSGVGDLPTGAACPLGGDVAIADCHDQLSTFNGTDCVAPVNAVCVIDAESKWGCVFPVDGNAEEEEDEEDVTSTLVISSEFSSEDSPWGDLPWRAPPRVILGNDRPRDEEVLQRSALLQVK